MKVFSRYAGELNENSVIWVVDAVKCLDCSVVVRLKVYDESLENKLRNVWHTIIVMQHKDDSGVVWIDNTKYSLEELVGNESNIDLSTYFLNGKITEIIVYDRILNDWECKWIVGGGISVIGMKLWLKFDYMDNNVVKDIANNGFDGIAEEIDLVDGESVDNNAKVIVVRGASI